MHAAVQSAGGGTDNAWHIQGSLIVDEAGWWLAKIFRVSGPWDRLGLLSPISNATVAAVAKSFKSQNPESASILITARNVIKTLRTLDISTLLKST
jgi:hypothetical protein